MSVKGEIREPFSGRTMDVPPVTNDLSEEIIKLSREKYCKPKTEVEELLRKWDEAAAKVPSEQELASVEEKFEEPLI